MPAIKCEIFHIRCATACDACPGASVAHFGRLGLCGVIGLVATALTSDHTGLDVSDELSFTMILD
jgi:hypothetical protein